MAIALPARLDPQHLGRLAGDVDPAARDGIATPLRAAEGERLPIRNRVSRVIAGPRWSGGTRSEPAWQALAAHPTIPRGLSRGAGKDGQDAVPGQGRFQVGVVEQERTDSDIGDYVQLQAPHKGRVREDLLDLGAPVVRHQRAQAWRQALARRDPGREDHQKEETNDRHHRPHP
jgi:hypothetical protein